MCDYANYAEWKQWAADFNYSTDDAAYFAIEFGDIARPGQKIIEIGFGNGGLMKWMHDHGAVALGIEVQEQLVAAAREKNFVVYSSLEEGLADHAGSIDAVIALDVFEHLTSDAIHNVLSVSRRLLKDTGRLILRVPNGLSPFSGVCQHGDSTHITTITPSKVSQLCMNTGMEVVSSRNQARAATGKLGRRLAKKVQFSLRDLISQAICAIYGLGYSTLDVNIVIELRPTGTSQRF